MRALPLTLAVVLLLPVVACTGSPAALAPRGDERAAAEKKPAKKQKRDGVKTVCREDMCAVCGNGKCTRAVENVRNCPRDCKDGGDEKTICREDMCALCGNGECTRAVENVRNCPRDCGRE